MSSAPPTVPPRGTAVPRGRRTGTRLAATLLVAATLWALVGAVPVRHPPASGQRVRPGPHAVLALGDSVPAGTACGCTSFPRQYGALLSRDTDASVTVDNEAFGGLDTTGLLAQLQRPRMRDAVRRSDVFLLTIGANDFGDQHDRVVTGVCAVDPGTGCVDKSLVSMRVHLARVLAEIRRLRGGERTSVLVTGYWNVFEDGTVARQASGAAGLRASIRLTRRVNSAISAVSRSAGAQYVDLFAPFQRHDVDIDSLLASDGDHPDSAGHRLIASELLGAGLRPLR